MVAAERRSGLKGERVGGAGIEELGSADCG